MNTQPTHVLVVQQSEVCHHCRHIYDNDYRVTVESIEQNDGIGWKLRGTGQVRADGQCPICAMIYDAVRTEIPIECKSYTCPECGELQDLKYKINKIEAQGSEFSFEAEISCLRCNRKKTFVQVLKELFKIKKLEIKLTGISLER